MLTVKQAKACIDEVRDYAFAHGREPGTWYKYHNHVYGAAEVARKIAEKIPSMNPERAYILGMVHDIGKFHELFERRFHGLLGYEILKDKDNEAARASLLHMFSFNKIPPYEAVEKMFFGRREDYNIVKAYDDTHPINDYDLLIQMADSLADSRGIVTLEQRAADFSKRHNLPIPQELMKSKEDLKNYFDKKIDGNIYDLFNKIPQNWMIKESASRE